MQTPNRSIAFRRYAALAVALSVALTTSSCREVQPIEPQRHGAPSAGVPGNSGKQSEPDWRAIFDGSSTDGWQMVGPGEFKLEKGELVTYGGMGLFTYTREKLGNCQVFVLFKMTGAHDNSGVFIRIPELPRDPWYAVNHGYEVQIENRGDPYHRTGCLYSLTKAKNIVSAPVGEWSRMLITLDGPRTIVAVNGQVVTDYTEAGPVPPKHHWYEPERGRRPESGYIGLQNHGDDARVHFKQVSVRPLR